MQVVLDEIQLSDLFFNHNNQNIREAYASADEPLQLYDPTVQEGLKKDAESFSDLMGGQVSPEWLIENYNSRV